MTVRRGCDGNCFAVCVYMSVLLLGILLSLVGIALVAVAFVAFEQRNSQFFVLGAIMLISALAVVIVAFYIRMRVIKDMERTVAAYANDRNQDPVSEICVQHPESVLSRSYALNVSTADNSPQRGTRQSRSRLNLTTLPIQPQSIFTMSYPQNQDFTSRPTSAYVYENPVALADETETNVQQTNTAVVLSSDARTSEHLETIDTSQPGHPSRGSPVFIRLTVQPPEDNPPEYSEHWILPSRQVSIVCENDEIPPSYEESLRISAPNTEASISIPKYRQEN